MFHLTPSFLKLLVELSKHPVWPAFIEEFKKIEKDKVEQALHFYPDPEDANAHDRETLLRGMAIAVSVLANGFKDPIALLEEAQLIERTEQKKMEASEASSF